MTRRRPLTAALPVLLAVSIVFLLGPWSVQLSHGQTVAIPELARWQTQMLTYGQQHCTNLATIKNGPLDPALGATYYDLTRVMHQIAAYTGDATWLSCADDATYVYRDRYVFPQNGAIPGYWNFSTGLRMDWQRTGDPRSQQGVVLLSTAPAYTSDYTDLSWIASFDKIREVAYALLSYINAEAAGQPRRARRATYVTVLHNHLAQLQDSSTWGDKQVAPFMMALGAEALIRDWEQTQDPRLVPALSAVADFFWYRAWAPTTGSMLYQINPANLANGGPIFNPAPDLNLLIAPVYAWLYAQTGDTKYRDQGDLLFANGVRLAWLVQSKQYNQNYRWSFDYVKWRGGSAAGATASTSPATVTFTAPATGSTVQGTVTVSASATGQVASLKLYLDGAALAVTTGASASYAWNTTAESNGTHTWKVTAHDAGGNSVATSTLTVDVLNQTTAPAPGPLAAAYTSPAEGATVSGTAAFTVAISGGRMPYRVEPKVDSTLKPVMTISAPTAVVAIDTTKLVNGRHRLSVKVRDAAGALVIINRHFNVANGYRD